MPYRFPLITSLVFLATTLGSMPALASDSHRCTYTNPVIDVGSADPGVIRASADGRYYLVNTFDFTIWSSTDLAHWHQEGSAKPPNSWGIKDFWAPEMVEYRNQFYLFYSAERKEGGKRIGVATSESPTGPFHDLGRPLFDFGYATIDAHPFIDDDGRAYLFFAKDQAASAAGRYESHIYGVELADDLLAVRDEPVLLTRPDQPWEYRSGNRLWNEGPYVIKHDATYYLMYSANFFGGPDYSVGYATATAPLGPYEKYSQNPILSSGALQGRVSGPGHHSVIASPDSRELFIVYHVHADPAVGGGDRRIAIDRIGFRDDGSLYVSGPTVTPQPLPSGATELVNIAPYATVTASSTRPGYLTNALIDGEFTTSADKTHGEWVSDQEGPGAWVRLEWTQEQRARWVFLYGSVLENQRATSGTLRLSNGTTLSDIRLPQEPGAAAIVPIPDNEDFTWLEFAINELALDSDTAGLSEMVVLGYPGGLPNQPGSLWISSPRRGSTLSTDTPLRIETLHISVQGAQLQLDEKTIYSGSALPENLLLHTAALAAGEHHLTAVATDRAGREYRYITSFSVEHLHINSPTAATRRLHGEVPIDIQILIKPEELTEITVGLIPITPEGAGAKIPLYEGSMAPTQLVLDTFDVADGAYDLQVKLTTDAGVITAESVRVLISNWETLKDPITPPLVHEWFGTIDRMKTTHASSGWVFAADRPEDYFGDAGRILRKEDSPEFLVWHLPQLQRFTLTLYATGSDIEETVTVSVSSDGDRWTDVPYTVNIAQRSESRDMLMLEVIGCMPLQWHAAYLRLLCTGPLDPPLQLGQVLLVGLQDTALP
jgi:GH43 family beta-xylosidase